MFHETIFSGMDGVDSSFVVDDDERWVCVLEWMVLVRENMVVFKRKSALAFGWLRLALLAGGWLLALGGNPQVNSLRVGSAKTKE
jgi:hypothetical protein